ncbi:MAG: iron chaperone [Algoriphagus aquaeductus]|uniref:iron chaperone n=1 Tax=Algoriphagus aquaeductus TaxID=475299 RepID=UPI00391C6686
MMNPKPTSVEEYFSWFSPEIQAKLQQIREALRAALPEAKEVISYHMPAFKTTEVLVYYAAAKSHLGYYPTNSGVEEFKKELAEYVTSKGAIQFPYDRELPLDLIAQIAQFRTEEAKFRAELKKKR